MKVKRNNKQTQWIIYTQNSVINNGAADFNPRLNPLNGNSFRGVLLLGPVAVMAHQSWEETPTFDPVGASAGFPQSVFGAPPDFFEPDFLSFANFASHGGIVVGTPPSEH